MIYRLPMSSRTRAPRVKHNGGASSKVTAKPSIGMPLLRPKEEKENASPSSSGSNVTELENFPDQLASMQISAVDNYFLRGKLPTLNQVGKKGRLAAKRTRSKRGETYGDEESQSEDDSDDEKPEPFPPCDLSDLREYMKTADDLLPKEIKQRNKEIIKRFPIWEKYLNHGFNIMLYGVGSKVKVIKELQSFLCEYNVMRVDAYEPDVNAKSILEAVDAALKLTVKKVKEVTHWAESIATEMYRRNENLIILLNNLDGVGLRDPVDQEALRVLTQGEAIRLVATVDHVNAGLLFDWRNIDSFNFVSEPIHTYYVPQEEIMAGESQILGLNPKNNQSSHSITSLDALWSSLAQNGQHVLALLFAMYYGDGEAVAFWDLAREAMNNLWVSTDVALRQQLVEFQDHRIIRSYRRNDGTDMLVAALDRSLVQKFMENKGIELDKYWSGAERTNEDA